LYVPIAAPISAISIAREAFRWAGEKLRDAVLIAGLTLTALSSAVVSALVTYPTPAHRQLLTTIEQLSRGFFRK
jgi:hypothetical protein